MSDISDITSQNPFCVPKKGERTTRGNTGVVRVFSVQKLLLNSSLNGSINRSTRYDFRTWPEGGNFSLMFVGREEHLPMSWHRNCIILP